MSTSFNHSLRGWVFFAVALIFQAVPAASIAQYADGARYAFASSVSTKSIHVIDIYKHQIAERIQLEETPDSVIASDQIKALIVPHRQERQLTLIDLSSKSLPKIEYPLNIHPEAVYLSPLGDTVALHEQTSGSVEVHALKRKDVLLKADGINTLKSLTFNIDGSRIFWTSQETGELKSIDLWSKTQSVRIAKPGARLSAMTRSTDGRLGFVSNFDRSIVTVVDLNSMKLVSEVAVGSKPGRPWGTADGQYMLVPNQGDGSVTAIATFSLNAVYTVPASSDPISINSGWLDSVAAVVGKNGEISFLDVQTGQQLSNADLSTQTSPGVVTSDSKTMALSSAGTVSFFDMRKQVLLSSIDGLPTDLGTISLAVSNNLCH